MPKFTLEATRVNLKMLHSDLQKVHKLGIKNAIKEIDNVENMHLSEHSELFHHFFELPQEQIEVSLITMN